MVNDILDRFSDPNEPQNKVLANALRISDYDTIANGAMAIIADSPGMDLALLNGIRAMALHIKTLDGTPGTILQSIATLNWQDIGIDPATMPTLDGDARGGIIGAVMAAAKSAIANEASNLESLTEIDTSLPPDWNDEGGEE